MKRQMKTQEIKGEGIILKPLTEADIEAIFKLRSNPETGKYTGMVPYADIPRAERFVKGVMADVQAMEVCFWGVFLSEEKSLVGTACLWNFSEDGKKGEVGYELMPEVQGRGIAQSAVACVCQYAFETLGLETLEAITHEENQPSLKLLEKSGFTNEGHYNNHFPDSDEPKEMLLYTRHK